MSTRNKKEINNKTSNTFSYLKKLFYIVDEIDEKGTRESIAKGVEFRGFTLYSFLLFLLLPSD